MLCRPNQGLPTSIWFTHHIPETATSNHGELQGLTSSLGGNCHSKWGWREGPPRCSPASRLRLQADRDPRDDEEAVPSEDEVEEPSQRAVEGSDDEGEDLMDGMEA